MVYLCSLIVQLYCSEVSEQNVALNTACNAKKVCVSHCPIYIHVTILRLCVDALVLNSMSTARLSLYTTFTVSGFDSTVALYDFLLCQLVAYYQNYIMPR